MHFYPRPPRGGRLDSVIIIYRSVIFLSTPSARRATPQPPAIPWRHTFLSTPSARRATTPSGQEQETSNISIHALREEGDRSELLYPTASRDFYPRPPRGGRPSAPLTSLRTSEFLSTPSARRATKAQDLKRAIELISIHALREEGDIDPTDVCVDLIRFLSTPSARRATSKDILMGLPLKEFLSTPSARRATLTSKETRYGQRNFYPRPPRGGRRINSAKINASSVFLSTPSARRATSFPASTMRSCHISIHALREEGDVAIEPKDSGRAISIHALREEGDPLQAAGKRGSPVFLSTPSARRATSLSRRVRFEARNFYPRPPRGGRPYFIRILLYVLRFLSTPSARRATRPPSDFGQSRSYFYPRPPRGGRPFGCSTRASSSNFYPRPPRGGRPEFVRAHAAIDRISIHALREEGDAGTCKRHAGLCHFYPRPPRGGRPGGFSAPSTNVLFLSTPSARRATFGFSTISTMSSYFYPRPPRGGRLLMRELAIRIKDISIHALREEGDRTGQGCGGRREDFYPRPPRGGRL